MKSIKKYGAPDIWDRLNEIIEKEGVVRPNNYDFIIEQILKIEEENNFQKEDFDWWSNKLNDLEMYRKYFE